MLPRQATHVYEFDHDQATDSGCSNFHAEVMARVEYLVVRTLEPRHPHCLDESGRYTEQSEPQKMTLLQSFENKMKDKEQLGMSGYRDVTKSTIYVHEGQHGETFDGLTEDYYPGGGAICVVGEFDTVNRRGEIDRRKWWSDTVQFCDDPDSCVQALEDREKRARIEGRSARGASESDDGCDGYDGRAMTIMVRGLEGNLLTDAQSEQATDS